MTKKKDLKKLIRDRMKKTGESYAATRRHVLAAERKICSNCGGTLERRIVREMADVDGDESEGQIADYFAAMESGDMGEWAAEHEEWYCPRCEPPLRRILRERLRIDK